jgi:hypothetical protein
MSDKVRIEINRSTREAMNETGKKGDTYDTLICEMVRVYDMYISAIKKNNNKSDDMD